ncbi:30S ribosomal protein S4 [Oscillospiraceae bacterium HV4-5-C5C]|nr:30S ribosomal protein S4 [Oscillospiraceae bacterium HV4-5-C5C]
MSTKRQPRFKLSRRLGVNICGHPKALDRLNRGGQAGQAVRRPAKMSEYGRQLLEKQKIKAYYGIQEKQLRRYYAKASRTRVGKPGEILLQQLECRLDNVVYRLGMARSLAGARQMVTHRHILLNGKLVNIPSHPVKPGDTLSLKESSREVSNYRDSFLNALVSYPYLSVDREQFSGRLERLPQRDELPIEVDEQQLVEFYNR